MAAAAVALFLLPVAVHGYSHWSRPPRRGSGCRRSSSPRCSENVPEGDVVFSDPQTAYELGAFAPVYINAAPQSHVANTRANRPTRARASDAAALLPATAARSPCPRATARTGCSSTARGSPPALPRCRASTRARGTFSTGSAMKVLLVTMYWPPAGGGGVQRPLKLATHLPALGIETHVLAPDDPKWLHRDEELRPPTQAFVHRARYLGPRARLPSEELHGLERHRPHARQGAARLPPPAAPGRERHLGPDGGARPPCASSSARASTP